jgi:hypothetical protein
MLTFDAYNSAPGDVRNSGTNMEDEKLIAQSIALEGKARDARIIASARLLMGHVAYEIWDEQKMSHV